MRDTLGESLRKLKWMKIRKHRMTMILLVLSLVVSVDVFWSLRQPGLTMAGDASCGILEHSHDEECRTHVFTCQLEENSGHTHEDACYGEQSLICSLSEGGHIHDEVCFEEEVLICSLSEEFHTHDETCFGEIPLICGLPEDGGHTHDEETCWEWVTTCGYEEHTHSIECYADKSADVENMLDWQEMFAAYPYTGNLREDLVGIAHTQVGYSESVMNFELGYDGERRGYTRYGAWYGTPYRDWSAAFVSFCLNYAGADPMETPGNTGADSMALLWDSLSKFAPAGTYTPVPGDLAFFTDNTVGIVAEVQNATAYVIQGDVDDAVCGTIVFLDDSCISGWGVTEGTVPMKMKPAEVKKPEGTQFSDISNGPVVVVYAGDGGETEQPMMRFALRTMEADDPGESGTGNTGTVSGGFIDLVAYLEEKGGSHSFVLLDENNQALETDGDGNYIVQTETGYKLTLSIKNPEGFIPGSYLYQLPDGLKVDGGTGTLILNETEDVGTWVVTEDGLITLNFSDEIKSFSELTISATMGIMFPEVRDPIDFDGKITVTIEKPQDPEVTTILNKWGSQGKEGTDKPDNSKIYWTINIIGQKGSQIPGSVLTDKLATGEYISPQHYTASDIENGLRFGVSVVNPETGAEQSWHEWTIYADDPNLTWNDDGWYYTIPDTAVCKYCGEIELGNNGWSYLINFSSTPDFTGTAGIFNYVNHVEVDGQTWDAWTSFSHGVPEAHVAKTGSFIGDADAGSFLWEFQVVIPGMQAGQKADHFWYIIDNMVVTDRDGHVFRTVTNDANKATVTAKYQGAVFNVPRIQDAAEDDRFAWHNQWSSESNGVNYGRALNLLCRCECTEENCPYWIDGRCSYEYWYQADNGNWYRKNFCQCWTATEAVELTFSYETEDLHAVEAYGSLDGVLHNEVTLYNIPPEKDAVNHGSAQTSVPIPDMFEKTLIEDFDGYTAHYRITVNEAKLALTNGSPLVIHDMMVDTLAFISGSLVITTEDANGNTETLKQGEDFTVTYDGTGGETDKYGKPLHVLEVTILRPQPVMYILDYDTTLIIPEGATQVKYSNSATISLWGDKVTDDSVEKIYADINIAARSYQVEMYKTCSLTGEPLGGATFGLYNAQGGLITTDVTDANGELLFRTNIVDGIVLREHVLYYMQELKAPPGDQLDDTKYWFCFCNEPGDSCEECEAVMAGEDAFRIPDEEIGKVHMANERISYNLPATGGIGIYPIVMVSVIFIITPLIYGLIRRCKRERRKIG